MIYTAALLYPKFPSVKLSGPGLEHNFDWTKFAFSKVDSTVYKLIKAWPLSNSIEDADLITLIYHIMLKRSEYAYSSTEESTIFKARTRMLDVKNNFRGKCKDTKCRKCTETVESQEHVLETCTGIHDDDTTKITINDIFDSNPTNLKTTAKQLL